MSLLSTLSLAACCSGSGGLDALGSLSSVGCFFSAGLFSHLLKVLLLDPFHLSFFSFFS